MSGQLLYRLLKRASTGYSGDTDCNNCATHIELSRSDGGAERIVETTGTGTEHANGPGPDDTRTAREVDR